MRTFWQRFFWGPPSHKPVAWIGLAAGLVILAMPPIIAVFGTGAHPVFLAALLLVGLAEAGWGIELLPSRWAALAGWGRAGRWLCAVAGAVLAVGSLLTRLAPL